jgi:hypothetical protein
MKRLGFEMGLSWGVCVVTALCTLPVGRAQDGGCQAGKNRAVFLRYDKFTVITSSQISTVITN